MEQEDKRVREVGPYFLHFVFFLRFSDGPVTGEPVDNDIFRQKHKNHALVKLFLETFRKPLEERWFGFFEFASERNETLALFFLRFSTLSVDPKSFWDGKRVEDGDLLCFEWSWTVLRKRWTCHEALESFRILWIVSTGYLKTETWKKFRSNPPAILSVLQRRLSLISLKFSHWLR